MESLKSVEMSSELSLSEVMGEQGNVLPERALMRHRRHSSGAVAVANNGSVANSSSVDQFGIGNSNTTIQGGTVINIL